ncbi:hypothetical protein EJ05DRAFT_497581 [Pseudovirgaria hyperparasitica]|uniref:Uncharacterized protein n=1 Tax=Pseudovirgaria hyperparasitica TaxID=470096 RepID=A0A6A6WG44_9PEZI|nr:uncharacterized protein EJ05DRAFT_497581 [Pseudovirgaria hyperparasitica]KAF2761010.1 hypothetical protein EJ05DRAFT_497581 [Pseudovirgaria hyperparasitica]
MEVGQPQPIGGGGHQLCRDPGKESASDLWADLLDHRSQVASSDMNKSMYSLTRKSVDDSATVRVITVFTLIYLPASFIATVLETNLFKFQDDSEALRIPPQLWIYVAVALPLTFLTVGLVGFQDEA